MKHDTRILPSLLAGLVLSIIVAPAQAAHPVLDWAQELTSPGTGPPFSPQAIAVDASGNVVTAGVFMISGAGGPLAFGLWKHNPFGFLLWSRTFSGASSISGLDVAVDTSGDILLTGSFAGTTDFGGGPITSVDDDQDIFIAKFAAAGGSHIWSRGFGSASHDRGHAIRADAQGRVFVAGTHFGVDLGGGPLSTGTGTEFPLFFAEFDMNGVHVSSRSIVLGGHGTVRDMAIAESGALYVTGEFPSFVEYDDIELWSAGSTDGFIAGFNPDGTLHKFERFGDGWADSGYGVAVAANGDMLLTGRAFERIVVGNRFYSNMDGYFVACYGADGVARWVQANTGSVNPHNGGYAVAPYPAGGAIVMGYFSDDLTVGIGHTLESRGTNNLFVVRYDSSGNPIWAGRFGPSMSVKGGGIVSDASGNVLVSSPNEPNMTLCTGRLSPARGFVLKFEPDATTDTQAPPPPTNLRYDGDQLTWDSSIDPEGAPVRYAVFRSEGGFPGGFGDETFSRSYWIEASNVYDNFLYVTAIDCYDNQGPPSARIEIHPSWTGPLAPSALHFNGSNLTWTAPTDADIAHYIVHTSPTPNWDDPGRTRIGLTTATSLDVRLRSAPYYFVTAADIYGIWGEHASLQDGLAPPVPTGLRFVGNRLYWDASLDRGFANFDLYSSPSPNFEGNGRVHLLTTRHLDMYVPKPNRNAYYFITQTDVAGNTSSAGGTGGGVVAETGEDVPNYQFAFSVHPNPTRGQMNFAYTLPSTGRVSIRVYNVTGSLVATVVDSEIGLGDHSANWNGRIASGGPVSAGIYFARIDYAGRSETRKLVLLR